MDVPDALSANGGTSALHQNRGLSGGPTGESTAPKQPKTSRTTKKGRARVQEASSRGRMRGIGRARGRSVGSGRANLEDPSQIWNLSTAKCASLRLDRSL